MKRKKTWLATPGHLDVTYEESHNLGTNTFERERERE
jgi:hypothetical protein